MRLRRGRREGRHAGKLLVESLRESGGWDLPQMIPTWLSTPVHIWTLTKFHVMSGETRLRLMMNVKRAIETPMTLWKWSVQSLGFALILSLTRHRG